MESASPAAFVPSASMVMSGSPAFSIRSDAAVSIVNADSPAFGVTGSTTHFADPPDVFCP